MLRRTNKGNICFGLWIYEYQNEWEHIYRRQLESTDYQVIISLGENNLFFEDVPDNIEPESVKLI